ncbi:hypothetical protein D3C75_1028330 [compost metagenome]
MVLFPQLNIFSQYGDISFVHDLLIQGCKILSRLMLSTMVHRIALLRKVLIHMHSLPLLDFLFGHPNDTLIRSKIFLVTYRQHSEVNRTDACGEELSLL